MHVHIQVTSWLASTQLRSVIRLGINPAGISLPLGVRLGSLWSFMMQTSNTQETKLVRIKMSVLTRMEYTEVIAVPADMSDWDLQELADQRYEDVDGGYYVDDGVTWDKGTVECVVAEEGAVATLQLVDGELESLDADMDRDDLHQELAPIEIVDESAPCKGHAANRLPVFVVRKTAEGDISTEVNVPARVVFLDEDTTGGCVLGEPGAALIDGKMCWVNDNCRSPADVSDVLLAINGVPGAFTDDAAAQEMPVVVIEVNGGLVQRIRSSVPVEILKIDTDIEGADDDDVDVFMGEEAYVTYEVLSAPVENGSSGVDPAFCSEAKAAAIELFDDRS